MENGNRINWLSVLQGWSMLLVVTGHVTLTNEFRNPATPISAEIERIIYGFHMPLFMFISGFLLYHTKISGGKDFKSVVKDKAKRLMAPFLFFTACTFVLKSMFNSFMRNPAELSLNELIDIITFKSNPLAEMWFVSTLFLLFLFYCAYQWSLKSRLRIIAMSCFCIILHLVFPDNMDMFNLSRISSYMIFLYAGILFSKYNMHEYLNSKAALSVCLLLFFFLNVYMKESVRILTPFAGILCSVSLCLFLSNTGRDCSAVSESTLSRYS
jgi:fucose 4-O-acetylase-like acetyltransferase